MPASLGLRKWFTSQICEGFVKGGLGSKRLITCLISASQQPSLVLNIVLTVPSQLLQFMQYLLSRCEGLRGHSEGHQMGNCRLLRCVKHPRVRFNALTVCWVCWDACRWLWLRVTWAAPKYQSTLCRTTATRQAHAPRAPHAYKLEHLFDYLWRAHNTAIIDCNHPLRYDEVCPWVDNRASWDVRTSAVVYLQNGTRATASRLQAAVW